MPPAKLLARPRGLREAIPARAMPLRNSLRCIMAWFSRFPSSFWLGRNQVFIPACLDFRMADGNTYRPRLIHSHKRQSAAKQSYVFAEVDHFIHALLRV